MARLFCFLGTLFDGTLTGGGPRVAPLSFWAQALAAPKSRLSKA